MSSMMAAAIGALMTGAGGARAPARAAISPQERTGAIQTYRIPAGSMAAALNVIADENDLHVLYDARLTDGLKTPGLSGAFSVRDALGALLVGTRLTYEFSRDGHSVSIVLAQADNGVRNDAGGAEALPPIDVGADTQRGRPGRGGDGTGSSGTAYQLPSASAGTKTDTPLMETPMTVQVVPQQVLKDLGVTSSGLSDALLYQGVQTRGYAPDTEVMIFRGFATASTLWNGFRIEEYVALGEGNGGVWMDNVDRLELLKGPSSILYGRAEPGGMVNVLTKRPLENFFGQVRAGVGSWSDKWIGFDLTGPLNEDKTVLFRLNASAEGSDSYFRYGPDYRSLGVAPSLEWRITPATTLFVEGQYRDLRGGTGTSYIPIDLSTSRLMNVDRSVTYPRDTLAKFSQNRTMVGLSHRFDSDWSLTWKYLHDEIDNPRIQYVFLGSPQISSSGNLTVSRNSLVSASSTKTDATILDVTGHVTTLGARHTLLFGGEYYDYHYRGSQGFDFSGNPAFRTDYFNQAPFPFDLIPLENSIDVRRRSPAFYVQDQIALPWNVHLLAGARYQRLQEDTSIYGNAGNYAKNLLLPRFGVLWRPEPWVSAYYSYSENSGNSTGLAFPGAPLKPEFSIQHEAGIKTEWLDGRLNATLAFFDLTKFNVAAADPLHPSFNIGVGEVESKGFEIGVQGALTENWNVLLNYTRARPLVKKGADSANAPDSQVITAGKLLPYVSNATFSFLTSYKLPWDPLKGWTLGGGVSWACPTNPTASSTLPMQLYTGYTVASAFTSYETELAGYKTALQLNVYNLFDEKYLLNFANNRTRASGAYGTPRQFKLSLRVEF